MINYSNVLIIRNEMNNYVQSVADRMNYSQTEIVIALYMMLCEHQRLALTESAYSDIEGSEDSGNNEENE